MSKRKLSGSLAGRVALELHRALVMSLRARAEKWLPEDSWTDMRCLIQRLAVTRALGWMESEEIVLDKIDLTRRSLRTRLAECKRTVSERVESRSIADPSAIERDLRALVAMFPSSRVSLKNQSIHVSTRSIAFGGVDFG